MLQHSQDRRKSQNTQQSFSNNEDQFLRFLTNESNYLESEQSSETAQQQQTLTKCKTEHALQTAQIHPASNSFNIFDKKTSKFTFATNECLEWETLQRCQKQEVFQLLSYMKYQCANGVILYLQEHLPQLIRESKITIKNPSELFSKLIEKGWILKTTRLFNDQQINFYSLSVKNITYEILVWVIRSIKRDLITPTERLVTSRIKECFGIKLTKQEWDYMINSINQQKSSVKFRNANGKLIEFPQLVVRRIKDPLINEDTIGIYFHQQQWISEDEFGQDLEKKHEWHIFTDFLKEFFSNATKDTSRAKILKGGRYGCAQFIKLLGPLKLGELSLGRLTLYVQMAVNKGIIKYNKTILIQNPMESVEKLEHTTDSSIDGDPVLREKIRELQECLIELLMESPEGVSLAQIPSLLKDKVSFEINMNELGFPKLKNFIESIKEIIQIENNGKNNYMAKLNLTKVPKKILQNIQQKRKQQQLQQAEYQKERLLIQILNIIKFLLSNKPYGVSITWLQQELSRQLGWEMIPYQQFQCVSFFQFLQNYAENILVIVCQKDSQYLIYERDHRFLPPPPYAQQQYQQQYQQQLQQIQTPTSFNILDQCQDKQLQNDVQFEQMLSEAFPQSVGLSMRTPRGSIGRNQFESSCSGSWLGRASDTQQQASPNRTNSRIIRQAPEDSHQEIKENLRFIEELLANDITNGQMNDNTIISDWSGSSIQAVGMISSINYGDRLHSLAHSVDFDLNKMLEPQELKRK